MISNQEFVAALVHGRRSRMAEGARLRAFAQAGTVAEVTGHVLTQPAAASAAEAQLRLVQGLAEEMTELVPYLHGAAAELLRWIARRFQVENLKLMIRRVMAGAPAEAVKAHLVRLPLELNGGVKGLSEAESMKVLARSMPRGLLRRELTKAMDLYHEQPRSFFFEAALDRGYFRELLERAGALPGQESAFFRPVVVQEIDIFHLMLLTRGKFAYGLELEELLPLHVPGTNIPRTLFASLLAETDLHAAAARLAGRVVDAEIADRGGSESAGLADPGLLERLAWSRFWRLANSAFRRSHMGAAVVPAYFELRRVEVMNLITIAECARMGAPRDPLSARLIPMRGREVTHV